MKGKGKQRKIYRVHAAPLKDFWRFVNERHAIYLRRKSGQPWPWTKDPTLQRYKFTNIFRELDRTTAWMRKYLTKPHEGEDPALMIFNCCVFRYFGTIEMSEALGWLRRWDWKRVAKLAQNRLKDRERVFTGAYMITNCGLAGAGVPKTTMVCREFLQPVWEQRRKLAALAQGQSLEEFCAALSALRGWGGGGFLTYEVATDLRHTDVLRGAKDKNTWANPGPGAYRGLVRIVKAEGTHLPHGEKDPVKFVWRHALELMIQIREEQGSYGSMELPQMELRDVEHSLCEFDKWVRVKYGEGRPRSRYGEDEVNHERV